MVLVLFVSIFQHFRSSHINKLSLVLLQVVVVRLLLSGNFCKLLCYTVGIVEVLLVVL